MNAHVAIPSGPVVKRLATDGTLLAFLRIAHTRRLQLLHVVVQLHLRLGGGGKRLIGGEPALTDGQNLVSEAKSDDL